MYLFTILYIYGYEITKEDERGGVIGGILVN